MDTLALLLLIGGALYLMTGGQAFANILQPSASGSGPAPGGILSASEIAQIAASAGFSGPDLVTAVAIALTESGGDPNAHGDLNLPGQGSFGLWQIYSYAHPEFGPNFAALFDPATNAAAAYQIYQVSGQRFSAWTGSYTNGLYLKFLPQAQAAVA